MVGMRAAIVLLLLILIVDIHFADGVSGGKKGKDSEKSQEKKTSGGNQVGARGNKPPLEVRQQTSKLEREGFAAMEARNFELCVELFSKATKLDPIYSDHHTQLATCFRSLGRKAEGIKEFEEAIAHMNDQRNKVGGDQYWASVHVNLGYMYAEGGGLGPGSMAKAADAFRQATHFSPLLADAYTYLGNALSEVGNFEEAAKVYETAIKKVVNKKGMDIEKEAYFYFHLAGAVSNLGDTEKAIKSYNKATKINPKFAAAYTNLGTIYQGRKMHDIARDQLMLAVKIDNNLAEAYTNLGVSFQDLGDKVNAVKYTRIAIELKPDLAPAHNNYGRALENDEQLENALTAYNKALSLSGSSYADAFCAKVYLEHFLCEWKTLEKDMLEVASFLRTNIASGKASVEPCVQPFRAFAYPLPHDLFKDLSIKAVNLERHRMRQSNLFELNAHRALDPTKRRLRIGYMSSDFGGHTVGSLIRNLLKMHNRNKVEIYGIGMMKGDGTEWNVEMEMSTDRFVSIFGMTDDAAAFAVDACEIHILVDLNGHSKGSRVGVLLRRPAPIITSFLGYPSTSGMVDDSIISDRWSTPPETKHLYTEKMVFLPHSYFVNDHRQLYPRPFKHRPDRRDYGMRDGSVVMGNFGQLYKVEPRLFDSWSRIIKRSGNSSLWLLKFPQEAVPRLTAYAEKMGVKDNMVLSPLLPIDSHLGIKAIADFGLDTIVFNGHTTGADTLWAGLPLISLPGIQKRSRAGATMAKALGVDTWLARNMDDYENLAIALARNRDALVRAKEEMEAAVNESPFFDTKLWAKGFERAWFIMWDTFQETGEASKFHIRVVPDKLEEEGLDWEAQDIVMGTTRHKREPKEGDVLYDPLKIVRP